LQIPGAKARAKILKTEFTDDTDTLMIDLSSAYQVKSLKKLERTFHFFRTDDGKLIVIDEVEFDRPESFDTALITAEKWKQIAPNLLQLGDGSDSVQVKIAIEGGEFHLDAQEIKEDTPGHIVPIRLGVELVQPVMKAKITLTVTPAE
jgi:hypothetical protein